LSHRPQHFDRKRSVATKRGRGAGFIPSIPVAAGFRALIVRRSSKDNRNIRLI